MSTIKSKKKGACSSKSFLLLALLLLSLKVGAVVRVNPPGVAVNAQNATVAFLTFGGLSATQRAAEGCWAGALVSAAPDIGFKCDPTTVFGYLPQRLDLSSRNGTGSFTDIMSIPPSVARRAYQDARRGAESRFFYVRRFVNSAGGPDEYVPVTCRLTGGGARTPFALTDVHLSFGVEKPVLVLPTGAKIPPIEAKISYNGSGRLKGRWEVVLPGEPLPALRDLLTEAALPVEERALQRRYSQVGRFNFFLPPGSKFTLPGPDPARLPVNVAGDYLILLRIEAVDDREGDSNLALAGAGDGIVHSGAVAGFPLPVLRYFIGGGAAVQTSSSLALWTSVSPLEGATSPAPVRVAEIPWAKVAAGTLYRLEFSTAEKPLFDALLRPQAGRYNLPPWLQSSLSGGALRWRVLSLDAAGQVLGETPWETLAPLTTSASQQTPQ